MRSRKNRQFTATPKYMYISTGIHIYVYVYLCVCVQVSVQEYAWSLDFLVKPQAEWASTNGSGGMALEV